MSHATRERAQRSGNAKREAQEPGSTAVKPRDARHDLLHERLPMLQSPIEAIAAMRRFFETGDDLLRLEEYQKDGNLVLRVEAPGIDPDRDAHVVIDRDVLTVSVSRRDEHRDSADGFRSEFRYGTLSRSIRVPHAVSADAVEAQYRDGVLTVTVPLPSADKATAAVVPVRRL
jgi:HSP20 family protein